jgi:hypothetical protein
MKAEVACHPEGMAVRDGPTLNLGLTAMREYCAAASPVGESKKKQIPRRPGNALRAPGLCRDDSSCFYSMWA